MKKKILIQIPCLNEESTIGKVVRDLKKNLPNSEIIVYDNFSTDDTIKEAKKNGVKVVLEKKKEKVMWLKECFQIILMQIFM